MSIPPANAHARLDDAAAIAFARPDVLICEGPTAMLASLAATYYGFWNNGSPALLEADAGAAFFQAFPDGRVAILQQLLVGDRIVSHLRITGTFTGQRQGLQGAGQAIDYLATDIMRAADGLIVENWHVEDHERLHRQLAAA
jgi:predicted ester cyclase